MTRRELLGSAMLAGVVPAAAAPYPENLGLQLYTLRNITPKDPRGVLKQVAAIGYREVETLRPTLREYTPLFKEFGLRATSGHFDTPVFTGDWTGWDPAPGYTLDKAIDDAKSAGLGYMVVPYLRPEQRGKLDFYKRFAEQLNRSGEKVHKAGLHLCYHNHAFEFEPQGGQRPFDVLMEQTDPRLVGLEMDAFWIVIAGEDPVAMLKRYSGRIPLMHVKDVAKGAPKQFSEKLPPDTFKEAGAGTLDFVALLRAGREHGVKHYFVEQDQCPGDPLASIRQSYQFLRSLKV